MLFELNGTTDQESGDYQYQLGLGAASNMDYEYAIKHFSEAINLSPNHWDAYYNRAICYANSKQLQLALDEMETLHNKMVSNGQSSVEVTLCMSQYYFDLKQFGRSVEWGKCALQFPQQSTNGEALLRIARAYFELKRPFKAHMYLTAYLESGNTTDLKNCFLLRSSCYLQEKMYDFAMADLIKVNEFGYEESTDKLIQEIKTSVAKQGVTYPKKSFRSIEDSAFSKE